MRNESVDFTRFNCDTRRRSYVGVGVEKLRYHIEADDEVTRRRRRRRRRRRLMTAWLGVSGRRPYREEAKKQTVFMKMKRGLSSVFGSASRTAGGGGTGVRPFHSIPFHSIPFHSIPPPTTSPNPPPSHSLAFFKPLLSPPPTNNVYRVLYDQTVKNKRASVSSLSPPMSTGYSMIKQSQMNERVFQASHRQCLHHTNTPRVYIPPQLSRLNCVPGTL